MVGFCYHDFTDDIISGFLRRGSLGPRKVLWQEMDFRQGGPIGGLLSRECESLADLKDFGRA